ncbi:beta-ketoacyl-ACP synthase III [Thermopetrobacter sp. TC1]|uniref:beta-ketoacyl-ACP synthase III n=1 Tax=Thermopetrobacter sp. TC1 TaxID=1495045 RepID=UPI00056E67C4|nr:beta-ketoacyl-ACP synthase III [Thermopetrobacter sp. TC1]
MLRSAIIGTGAYLPEKVLTNDDLAEIVDTSDEWIRTRTGIRQRHIAADGELTSDLAVHAARNALADAGLGPADIDMILVATTTPDRTFPATAATVQEKLGITHGGPAFDVQAVCSGFLYGLATADAFIRSGQVRTVLLIGAETFSRILDWQDRGTCVLFGDGAGAVIMRAEEGRGDLSDRGVLATRLHADGRYADLLYVDGGPSAGESCGKVRMKGREVFRHAVVKLAEVTREVLDDAGARPEDIALMVPHQANIRILEATAKKLGLPPEKVHVTVDRHGNTSAASVPLALDDARRSGRLHPGDLVLLEAMGGGFTWGASLVRL